MPHITRKAAIKIMRDSQGLGSVFHPGIDSCHVDAAVAKVSSMRRHIMGTPIVKQEEDIEITEGEASQFREIIEDGKIVFIIE
jgi:hypothetical protein